LRHQYGGRFGRVHADGFFDQNMLARFGGFDRPLRVHRVRRGDINRVDFRVIEQRLITAVRSKFTFFCAYSAAKASALCCVRLPIADKTPVCDSMTPSANSRAMWPAPMMPQRKRAAVGVGGWVGSSFFCGRAA
jgi:hypothetical protein